MPIHRSIRPAAALAVASLLACGKSGPAAPATPPAGPAPEPQAAAAPAGAPAPSPVPRGGTAAAGEDWGEPDMAKLQRFVRRRMPDVKRCYEAALQRDEGASGKLTLRFTIATSGAVEDVRVARTTFGRREVPDCIAGAVRGWRTPFHPAEPVEVEYPFRFSPK